MSFGKSLLDGHAHFFWLRLGTDVLTDDATLFAEVVDNFLDVFLCLCPLVREHESKLEFWDIGIQRNADWHFIPKVYFELKSPFLSGKDS